MSSTIPSAKYSCSGSPLIFVNGNTANDGLSGRASAAQRATFRQQHRGYACCLVDDRPDIAIAAARQCLDPIFAAGFFRKDPPQRRNLNG